MVAKYSHLNGEEYLLVHHKTLYKEIQTVIKDVDAKLCLTKMSKEESKARKGKMLYSPEDANTAFKKLFREHQWKSVHYSYYITNDRALMEKIIHLPPKQQRAILQENGAAEPLRSYKQTDFVKDKIAVEVQFGKYSFVAYDLFVKHLLFYSGGVINVGIEILPVKAMQTQMSSGIAYYEGEVYNVLRHGRGNPPVPLLILGVAP